MVRLQFLCIRRGRGTRSIRDMVLSTVLGPVGPSPLVEREVLFFFLVTVGLSVYSGYEFGIRSAFATFAMWWLLLLFGILLFALIPAFYYRNKGKRQPDSPEAEAQRREQ